MQERQEEPSDCIAGLPPVKERGKEEGLGGKNMRLWPSSKKCSAILKEKP